MSKSETGPWVNRWWLVLLHGILLIGLSYQLMSHTDVFLNQVGRIISFLALLTGAMSIVSSLLSGAPDKSPFDLWWGLLSCSTGIFFMARQELSAVWVQWLLVLFMIINASYLFITSLQQKPNYRIWVYALCFMLFTLWIVYMFVSNTWFMDLPPFLYAGLQFFLNGILLTVTAFGIRKIQKEYGLKLSELRKQSQEQPPLFL